MQFLPCKQEFFLGNLTEISIESLSVSDRTNWVNITGGDKERNFKLTLGVNKGILAGAFPFY